MAEAPSAWKIERALSAWNDARQRVQSADLDDDSFFLTDLLETQHHNVRDVLSGLVQAIVHCEDMAEATAKRLDELELRCKRYNKRAEALRETTLALMEAIGEKKVELADATVSVRAGRSKVVVTDETKLPAEYKRTKTETAPDKIKIGADLIEGVVIDGAMLSNPMPSLHIRK